MGFTSAEPAEPQPVQKQDQPDDRADLEPSPEELRNFLSERSDHDPDSLEQQAARIRDGIQFLDPVATYYIVGQNLGIDVAAAFETKQQQYSLELANIRPEMTVTTTATVANVAVEDPDEQEWTRQDIRLTDDSGSVKFVLWNEDIRDDLDTGDEVKLVDCWAKTYNGSVQLSLGKSGRIET